MEKKVVQTIDRTVLERTEHETTEVTLECFPLIFLCFF